MVALRGARGGWELAHGWRTQVPGLNAPELQALLMAQPRVLGHPSLAAAAESAITKLIASLTGAMRQQAEVIRERLHVDPRGRWESGEDVSVLPILQEAVARQRSIAFDYERADGQAGRRTADPLGIVAKGVTWYLVAGTSAGMRTFRVSRMANTVLQESGFERPARFDLAKYWLRATAELEERRGIFSVLLAAAPEEAQRIRIHRPTASVERSKSTTEVPAGWKLLRVAFEEERQARFVVLGLGAKVRVLDPPEFGRSIAAEIRAVANFQ